MKRIIIALGRLTVIMAFLFTSCYETGKITRRYTAIENNDPDSAKHLQYIHVNGIALDVDSLQPPKKTPKNVFSLSDHGQQAYINSIKALAGGDPKAFAQLMPQSLEKKDNSQSIVQHTTFNKRLAFSVQDASPYEADRITRLTIKIPIQANNKVHITSISQLQTAYATVNIGTVSLTNALTAGLTASYGLTGGATNSTTNTDYGTSTNGSGTSNTLGTSVTPTAGVSGTLSNTRTFAESVNLNNRYVALSIGLVGDSLEIYEESIAGVNLIGNVFVDITFEANQPVTRAFAEIGDVFEDKTDAATKKKLKVPVSSDALPISLQYVSEPPFDSNLVVPYSCTARVRHVKDHQRTILESDDIISYVEGNVNSGTPLTLLNIEKVDTRPFVMEDSSHNYAGLVIRDNTTGQEFTVVFDDYFQALNLLRWLKREKKDGKVLCNNKDGFNFSDGVDSYSFLTTDPTLCIEKYIDKAFVHALR